MEQNDIEESGLNANLFLNEVEDKMASNATEKNTSLTQSIPLQPKYISNFSFDRLLCNRLIQSHFDYKSNIFPLLNRNFKN